MNQVYLSEAIEKLHLNEAFSDSFPDWLRKYFKNSASSGRTRTYSNISRKKMYGSGDIGAQDEYARKKLNRQLLGNDSDSEHQNLFQYMTRIGYDLSNAKFVDAPRPNSLSDPIFNDPDKLPVMHVVTDGGDYVYIPGVNDFHRYQVNGRNRKFADFNDTNLKNFVPEDGFGYIDLSSKESHIPDEKVNRDPSNTLTYSGDPRMSNPMMIRDAKLGQNNWASVVNNRYNWKPFPYDFKNMRLNSETLKVYNDAAKQRVENEVSGAMRRGYYYGPGGRTYFDANNPSEVAKMRKDVTNQYGQAFGSGLFDKSGYWRGESDLNKVADKLQQSLKEIKVKKLPKTLERLGNELLSLKDAVLEKQQILMQNADGMEETADAFRQIADDISIYKVTTQEYFKQLQIIESGQGDETTLDKLSNMVKGLKQSLEEYKTRDFLW